MLHCARGAFGDPGNGFGRFADTTFAGALPLCAALSVLDLNCNYFGGDGAHALADAAQVSLP